MVASHVTRSDKIGRGAYGSKSSGQTSNGDHFGPSGAGSHFLPAGSLQ